MERSILFRKYIKVIGLSISASILLIIIVSNPNMETGWKIWTSVSGGLIIIGATINALIDIHTSLSIKDYNDKQDQLIECNKRQIKSSERLEEAFTKYNSSILFLEKRHEDDYTRLRKDLNENKSDDLKTKDMVHQNKTKLSDHEKRIRELEKKK